MHFILGQIHTLPLFDFTLCAQDNGYAKSIATSKHILKEKPIFYLEF